MDFVGKTISHYDILEKLGAGSLGTVYKARDKRLRRIVALKVLSPDTMRNEEHKNAFISDAQAASALDHQNICTIYEISETAEGYLYIAMSCYVGESLGAKIKRGPLSIETATDIAIQVALGLAKAHSEQIIHHDIRPANILITNDGLAKIVDFGLAKLAAWAKVPQASSTSAVAAYMSPEQVSPEQAGTVDRRTDLWSLGVVMYEMVTGQIPFKGDSALTIMFGIVHQHIEPVTSLRTGISLELEQITNKCLSKDPNDRYQYADDLIVDLRRSAKKQAIQDTSGSAQTSASGQTRYEIIKELGKGATGDVILANDSRLRRRVALKFLSPAMEADQEYVSRFVREACTHADLNHPNIVHIYDWGHYVDAVRGGRYSGRTYIAMEYVEGQSLRALLDSSPRLPLVKALEISTQICEALAYAHQRGVMHRDIKPDNILVTPGGQIKLVDFGLARSVASTTVLTQEQILGTPHYMSPEQAMGEDSLDHRTDIFSFGIVLYELVTGQRPFRGKLFEVIRDAIRHEDPKPVSNLNNEASPALQEIIDRALAKAPNERYQEASEILSELKREIEHLMPSSGATVVINSDEEIRRVAELLGNARKLYAKGDRQPALEALEQLLSLDSGHSEATELSKRIRKELEVEERVQGHLSQADAFLESGEPQKASKTYQKALELDRENDRALAGIEQAKAVLARLQESNSLISEGSGLIKNGNHEDALAVLQRAQKLDPEHQEVANLIAECESTLKERERVAEFWRKARGSYEKRQRQEALAALEQLLSLDSGHSEAIELIERIRKELELEERVQGHLSEADAFLLKGEHKKAIKAFESALKIDPRNRIALAGLERVKKERIQQDDTVKLGPTQWHERGRPGRQLFDQIGQYRKHVSLALLAVLIIASGLAAWRYFGTIKLPTDPAEPALAAKQQMLNLKQEAVVRGAKEWANDIFDSGARIETQAEMEFKEGQYEAARSSYHQARDEFEKSIGEAEKNRSGDLERVRQRVLSMKQQMLNDKEQAEAVPSESLPQDLMVRASARREEGNKHLAGGSRTNLEAALESYSEARTLYRQAREGARLAALKVEAIKAQNSMRAASDRVPGTKEIQRNNAVYNQAENLAADGSHKFELADYQGASSSYLSARDLYVTADRQITAFLVEQAESAKSRMTETKAKISSDYFSEQQYQDGRRLEIAAEEAFRERNFEETARLFGEAERTYLEVVDFIAKAEDVRRKEDAALSALANIMSRLKESFENRDIAGLNEILNLSEKNTENWSRFFESENNVKQLRAQISESGVQTDANQAGTVLAVTLTWLNNRNVRQELALEIEVELQSKDNEWMVSRVHLVNK